MYIDQLPPACVQHLLTFLDLPDQYSLLLTCSALFYKVVPGLYRSPFRAILACDGWRYGLLSHVTSNSTATTTATPHPPHPRSSFHHTRSLSNNHIRCNSIIGTNCVSNSNIGLSNVSTSSISSSSSTVSTLSSDLTANTTASAHRATSAPLPRYTPAQIHRDHHTRPSSLRQHSFEYRTQGTGMNSTVAPRNRSSISRSKSRNFSYTNTSAHSSAELEQLKLKKITRLLQLLIACTSVQARLPALRYPGYGQQWIRPPCRVDYLQYYVDQEQGGDIMIRCFHLLFADLIHCQWEDETAIPTPSPDKEAFKVLYQIQNEFMTHNAAQIRTLSLSVVHTVNHATTLVHQLAMVTRLELTDLGDASFQAEPLVDFIKSHRMLFGPVLKEIILVEKQSSATSVTPFTFPSPASPTITPFTGYSTRITSASNVAAVVEAFRDPECIDATAWANCILHLDRLSTGKLKKLWLSYAFPPFEAADGKVARLAEFFERCRGLEQIRVPIRRSDVFAWAAQEKKTALVCAPILAGSKSKQLPSMRTVHIQGPTLELMDCVQDVAFAFQDTLEDLEAYSRLRVWQPSTMEWQWAMPRLTRLRLEGEISLYFCLDSLKWCSALEELSLATMATENRKLHPHLTLPAFHSLDPGLNLLIYIRSQELQIIANLKRLRVLNICGPWQIPDTVLRRIAERCRRLKVLHLDQTVGTTIGGILLAVENMHRLERLALRLNIADLVLVRVVIKKLAFLSSLQLTSLCKEG